MAIFDLVANDYYKVSGQETYFVMNSLRQVLN